MRHYSRWQTAAILGVTLLVSLAAVPNLLPMETRARLPVWAQHTFVLGYDLQGGTYVQFEVDAQNMRQQVLHETREEMRGLLRLNRVHFTGLVIRNDGVEAWIREATDMPRVIEAFNNLVRPIDPAPPASDRRMLITRNVDGRPGIWASRSAKPVPNGYHLDIAGRMVRLTPTDAVLRQRVAQARRANEAAIRERLRFMGAEKLVRVSAVGADRIVVDAPYSDVVERFMALRF